MRVSIRRFALALSLPALAGAQALAQEAYSDDGQPPAAIALFTSENFYGDVREAFDPFASMHDLAFNDRARSVAVLAGQWELCEHANFTGRCVFVREDVGDLAWFGLNGRVSSIRPVFEYTEAQHGLMFTRDDNGYIRYAHNEAYGYDTWNYGYSSAVRLSVQHYGYSPDYWRFGYYDPRWGFDPYGFAWRPSGGPRYVSYTYRVHPRPVVINTYWKKHWGQSHKHWDRRGHRDDWRQRPSWGGRDDHRGPGRGYDRGPGRGDGRGNGDWNRDRDQGRDQGRDRNWDRDRDRTDGRPGRGGDDRGLSIPPRERVDERDRGWSAGERAQRGGDGPRTERTSPPRTGGGLPVDPRRGEGRGDWQGRRDGGAAIVTPPASVDRGGREGGWRGGDRTRGEGSRGGGDRPGREGLRGEGRGRGGDSLLGAPDGGARPVAEIPRRGGGDRGRGGEGGRGGGDFGRRGGGAEAAPAPAARPSPPPTAVSRPAPSPRVEGGRGRGGDRGGDRDSRRPGRAQD